jgi:putative transposase
MSAVISISAGRRYGVARVCRAWGVSRSSLYRGRTPSPPSAPRRRPGPQGPMPDAGIVEAIRQTLAGSPFHGEGYRKVWARLRHAGLRTSKERVRRLMRENGLQAANRPGRPRGLRSHDGTIIPGTIDTMWGTDMTAGFTLEPIRQGVAERFGTVDKDAARGSTNVCSAGPSSVAWRVVPSWRRRRSGTP